MYTDTRIYLYIMQPRAYIPSGKRTLEPYRKNRLARVKTRFVVRTASLASVGCVYNIKYDISSAPIHYDYNITTEI